MEILDLIAKVKALTAAVREKNITAVLDVVGDLAKLAAVIVGGFKAAGDEPVDFAEADAALAELEGEAGFKAADGEVGAVDPATILIVLSLVKTVFDLIKKRWNG